MKIYARVIRNEILSVDIEQMNDDDLVLDINSFEDFIEIGKDYSYNDRIEDKVSGFIDDLDYNEESLKRYEIKHWVSNRSFGELIDMYENEEIIKPNMQRNFVWDSIKCSRLIESIVLGLPIPPLFLLEVRKNKYELIDGYQRLTAVFNYVKGEPWHMKSEDQRKVKSRLSKKIADEIAGKSFDELDNEHKRIIRRSTIPLIEFSQLDPASQSSKYLIFERINTGSEKLNYMQIRKSLAHGMFMDNLYDVADIKESFKDLFSVSSIKKDKHVEAYLRIIAMTDLYLHRFKPEKLGIKNILNEYCERNKSEKIDRERIDRISEAMDLLFKVFDKGEIFRRVEMIEGKYQYSGNINISIMESLVGILSESLNNESGEVEVDRIKDKYEEKMSELIKAVKENKDKNPFTTSTGSQESINRRFEICKEIID